MKTPVQIHKFDTGPFNWYLIEQDGRLSLIDAGFPSHYAVLINGLASINRTLQDIEAIVITHAHADHTGFAARLSRETGAPIFVHAADREALTRVLQLPWWGLLSNAWRPYVSRMLLHATFNGIFTMPRVSSEQLRVIKDGQQLEIPGRPFVLHTPGHTPGEVSLHLPEVSTVICGDTLVTRDVMSGALTAPAIMADALTDDPRAARKSLDTLRGLGDVTLHTGHGQPWKGNLAEAVTRALELHART